MKLFLSKKLIFYIGTICILYMAGCVDVNNSNVSTVDLRSPVKFVNLVHSDSAFSVSVDGTVVTNVTYGNSSSYLDLKTGARKFTFSYGSIADTVPEPLGYDTKYTMFNVFEPSAFDTAREYFLVRERNTYNGSNAFIKDSIMVRFLNFSPDTAGAMNTIHFRLNDTIDIPLSYEGVSFYVNAAVAGNPHFDVVDGNSTSIEATTAIASTQGRYSVVLFGLKATSTIQVKVYKED